MSESTTIGPWLARLDRFMDWFIPPEIAAQREQRDCARMFLVSHLFGPVLGNVLPLYLLVTGSPRDYKLAIFFGSITLFWVFPFALRAFGRHYRLLVTISVEVLIFTIFWACFNYGGPSSPFLPWALTIPLLAFFYVGRATWMIWTLPVMLAANLVAFWGLYALQGGYPPVNVSELHIIGLLSIVSAACYVSMMALYYASVLSSQADLEREVREHLETAASLQRAVAASERAAAAKSEFLAGMSHELRTPLNAVIGYSELLLEEAESPLEASTTADLQHIHKAGRHLLSLVNDVLDYSKIDAGKMEPAHEEVNIREFLQERVDEAAPLISANGNTVSLTFGDRVGCAELDAGLVRNALDHVLNNAAKYTVNGAIQIHAQLRQAADGERLDIHVRDSGCGIAADRIESIFDAFSGADDESSTNYGAAGLGLALTRKICRLLGGDVSVASKPGEGSTFTISLPSKAPPESACSDQSANAEIRAA